MSEASLWVERYIGGAPQGGRLLDVACGGGRHLTLARELGFDVVGIDRDVAAARLAFSEDQCVELLEYDLENGSPFPFAGGSFDCVIVTNYLWRPILSGIVDAVSPAGMLIYETFRLGHERFGKPSRPDFLLLPGELLSAVAGRLQVVAYEEVTFNERPRMVQRICSVGPLHPWVGHPPTFDNFRTRI